MPGVYEDHRPQDCRNRLQHEGKPHPRSGCAACTTGGLTGCPYDRRLAPPTAGPGMMPPEKMTHVEPLQIKKSDKTLALFACEYRIGDRVYLGDDREIKAVVTGLLWRGEGPQVEVAWVHAGTLHSQWANPPMLRPASEAEA